MAIDIDGSLIHVIQAKTCCGCGKNKHLNCFSKHKSKSSGFRSRCKQCEASATSDYRALNTVKCFEYDRRYKSENIKRLRQAAKERGRIKREADPESVRAYKRAWAATQNGKTSRRAWNLANPDKVRAHAAKRRSTPKGRLENSVRSQVNRTTTKGSKEGRRTFELLGYSVEKLREHLERQFKPQMSWKNYGEWHIDHILPLSFFSYATPADSDFSFAWALANLRPMWATENLAKSDHRTLLI